MKYKHLFLLICALVAVCPREGVSRSPEWRYIPLPEGASISLIPVFLGLDGEKLIEAQPMTLGNRSEQNFQEALVEVEISGSFRGRNSAGKQDWYYLLGETEVTTMHWWAVMKDGDRPQGGKNKEGADVFPPKSNVTPAEIQLFLEKLNQLIVSRQSSDKILLPDPPIAGARVFFRLPTEAEWEFAARGGLVSIKDNRFDLGHPYPEDILGKYEYFDNGQAQSKPLPSGSLECNPLGFQDMLGNVSEFVGASYFLGYIQGRCGGYVARGGNYLDPISRIRASRRSEVPPCAPDGRPFRLPTYGFRLCLASAIYGGGKVDDLEQAWKQYAENRPVPKPRLLKDDAAQMHSASIDEAKKRVEQFADTVKAADTKIRGLSESKALVENELNELRERMKTQSNLLSAKLDEIDAVQRASIRREAKANVRVGTFASFQVERLREIIENKKKVNVSTEADLNDLSDMTAIRDICRDQLRRVEREIVKTAIDERRTEWENAMTKSERAKAGFDFFEKECLQNR